MGSDLTWLSSKFFKLSAFTPSAEYFLGSCRVFQGLTRTNSRESVVSYRVFFRSLCCTERSPPPHRTSSTHHSILVSCALTWSVVGTSSPHRVPHLQHWLRVSCRVANEESSHARSLRHKMVDRVASLCLLFVAVCSVVSGDPLVDALESSSVQEEVVSGSIFPEWQTRWMCSHERGLRVSGTIQLLRGSGNKRPVVTPKIAYSSTTQSQSSHVIPTQASGSVAH